MVKRMFSSLILLACMAAMSVIVGCASPAIGNVPAQTPAQIAQQVCPPLQIAIGSFQALAGVPASVQADLTKAEPLINDVCAPGALPTSDNLQAIAKTALPTLMSVIKISGLTVTQQNNLVLGISSVQIILAAVDAAQAAK